MKLKSSKAEILSTNDDNATLLSTVERPVIELRLPNDQGNIMMAELSHRFSLLRRQTRDSSSIGVIQHFHINSPNPQDNALGDLHFDNSEQTPRMESSSPVQPDDQPQNIPTWSSQLESSRHHQQLVKSLSVISDSCNSKISSDEQFFLKSIPSSSSSCSSSLSSSYRLSRDHPYFLNVTSTSNDTDIYLAPSESLSNHQLISPSNIRYMDLLTIQQTLISSAPSPPPQSAPPPSWASFTPPPLSHSPLLRRQTSSSTTSRTSLDPLPVRSPLASDSSPRSTQIKLSCQPSARSSLNQPHRIRSKSISTERSRPSGSSSIVSLASAYELSKPNHFQPGLPGLASSLHTISPDLQSFPVTPLPHQTQLDSEGAFDHSESLPDVTGQEKVGVVATGFPLQEVKGAHLNSPVKKLIPRKPLRPSKSYSTTHHQPEEQASLTAQSPASPNPPLTHAEPFSGFFPRQRVVSGRVGRPVPTTLLFKDVEAQAVAANVALGLAFQGNNYSPPDGAKAEEGDEKKRKKKKSIVRAQIGAPTLLSASSNLASVVIQPVLSEHQDHSRQDDEARKNKVVSVRGSFKIRLRKKKTSETPASLRLPLTINGQTNATLPFIDQSRLMMSASPIMSPMEENPLTKETSSPPSKASLMRRETDPGLLSTSGSPVHCQSRSSDDGSSNKILLGRWKDSSDTVGQAQAHDKILAGHQSQSDEASNATGHLPSLPNGGTASISPDGHGSLKKSIRKLLNPRGAHAKLFPLADGGHYTSTKPMNGDSILEEQEEERGDPPCMGSPQSSDWVNVGLDSVAPLKIMKVSGGTIKRSQSRAFHTELPAAVGKGCEFFTGVPTDQGPQGATTIDPGLLDSPPVRVVVEERESTDSVQRLFSDLGLPQREDDKRSSKAAHCQLLESRWSSAARDRGSGRGGAQGKEGDEQPGLRTQWSRSTDAQSLSGFDVDGDTSSKQSKARAMMTVEDVDCAAPGSGSGSGPAVGSPDLVVVAPAGVEGPHHDLLLHPQQQQRRRKASEASSASLLRGDGSVAGTGEEEDRDAKSDYAASILDLYDRPDSIWWDDGEGGGSTSQPVIQSSSEVQVSGVGVRPRKRSFLDGHYLTAEPGDTDDVMDMMNRFRRDLSSSRVSTASALLLDGAFSSLSNVDRNTGRSLGAAGIGGGAGSRRTVVDDEEDEERVWKIILGR